MSPDLTDREGFRRVAEAALAASSGDHTLVSLRDRAGGTTRFANNQVVQNVNTRRSGLAVSVAFGQQRGTARTTQLSEQAVAETVRRAEEIARVSPPDPEYLPPLPPQRYPLLPTLRPETAAAGPGRRMADATEAIKLCQAEGLEAAGTVSTYASAVGVAASGGLFAYEHRTQAGFSLTATGADSTGWVKNADRSIDDLGVEERTRIAIDKAKRSANPRGIPAGRYTVILEPAAVAGLVGPLLGATDAKAYHRGTSALSERLGQSIIDRRLTVRNRPDHPSLIGGGFNEFGLPSDAQVWIEGGVLKRLDYDRFTAQEHGTRPSYRLDALHLAGDQPAGQSVDDLISATERGVLVTNLWYIRHVDPTDLTLTGMTRDGTFLVEDGRIVTGLINFRWHESPLRAFNQVVAFTTPLDASTAERRKMFLPAMTIRDFNFSSVTRF